MIGEIHSSLFYSSRKDFWVEAHLKKLTSILGLTIFDSVVWEELLLARVYKRYPVSHRSSGVGDGTPPQYSCLENPMDGGAW